MKKILLIAAIIISLIGCSDLVVPRYRVKMEIHYPSKIDTITVENGALEYPTLTSYKGTNRVSGFYSTTAPIKILSITEIPDSTKIEE